jgi:hypothetical protein
MFVPDPWVAQPKAARHIGGTAATMHSFHAFVSNETQGLVAPFGRVCLF